jgi:N-methylhydantoinase B
MLAVAVMQALDAITLSVIQAALQQVCDEMDLTFSRAAFSPVIAEANDRSDGIYSAVDGSLIAQGSQGLPVFVGVMQYSTRTIIEMIARALPAAGRGRHLYRQRPLSRRHPSDGRALRHAGLSRRQNFLLAVEYRPLARHGWRGARRLFRVGDGCRAGRAAPAAGKAVQEGHALDPEIHAIISSNIRVADQRIGDIKAQAAALTVGRHGWSKSSTAMATRRSSRRSPNCAAAPPIRCARISRPWPTGSTGRKPMSIPTVW